jgi:lipopolysaccharide export system protein LptA
MTRTLLKAAAVMAFLLLPVTGHAQGASFPLGGSTHDSSLPVEVLADQLTVDQASGASVFSGNAVVSQGDMRLAADSIRVEYHIATGEEQRGIERLVASGNVTLVTNDEAAESNEAIYSVSLSRITMTGDVILTQGRNILSGDLLIVDLASGQGSMQGRVRTILQTGN